jgi:hypothetical protein
LVVNGTMTTTSGPDPEAIEPDGNLPARAAFIRDGSSEPWRHIATIFPRDALSGDGEAQKVTTEAALFAKDAQNGGQALVLAVPKDAGHLTPTDHEGVQDDWALWFSGGNIIR